MSSLPTPPEFESCDGLDRYIIALVCEHYYYRVKEYLDGYESYDDIIELRNQIYNRETITDVIETLLDDDISSLTKNMKSAFLNSLIDILTPQVFAEINLYCKSIKIDERKEDKYSTRKKIIDNYFELQLQIEKENIKRKAQKA